MAMALILFSVLVYLPSKKYTPFLSILFMKVPTPIIVKLSSGKQYSMLHKGPQVYLRPKVSKIWVAQ